jgi:hypothetical protein
VVRERRLPHEDLENRKRGCLAVGKTNGALPLVLNFECGRNISLMMRTFPFEMEAGRKTSLL